MILAVIKVYFKKLRKEHVLMKCKVKYPAQRRTKTSLSIAEHYRTFGTKMNCFFFYSIIYISHILYIFHLYSNSTPVGGGNAPTVGLSTAI